MYLPNKIKWYLTLSVTEGTIVAPYFCILIYHFLLYSIQNSDVLHFQIKEYINLGMITICYECTLLFIIFINKTMQRKTYFPEYNSLRNSMSKHVLKTLGINWLANRDLRIVIRFTKSRMLYTFTVYFNGILYTVI